MTSIINHQAAASSILPVTMPPQQLSAARTLDGAAATNATSDELRLRFTQFVGETFFGHMIKAMRSTVGKPAYFHGGRGEEVFRGQLDQALAEQMTAASAERFAEPMFRHQFPHLAPPPDSNPPAKHRFDQRA